MHFPGLRILTSEDKTGTGRGEGLVRSISVHCEVHNSRISVVERLCDGGTSPSQRGWNTLFLENIARLNYNGLGGLFPLNIH